MSGGLRTAIRPGARGRPGDLPAVGRAQRPLAGRTLAAITTNTTMAMATRYTRKTTNEWRRRYASRKAITRNPLTADAAIPHTKGHAMPEGRPDPATSMPLRTPAPAMMGSASRNENLAADSRSSPRTRPAVMVTPERDTPGCSATAWATPSTTRPARTGPPYDDGRGRPDPPGPG